jgi:hypothetical protein
MVISQSSGEPEIEETKLVKVENRVVAVFSIALIYTAKFFVIRHIIG